MKDEIDDLIVEYNKIDDRKENEQKKLYESLLDVVSVDMCPVCNVHRNNMQCSRCSFRM